MKSSEAEKHGDVSPLSGSLSNLVDGAPAPEPSFERLSNFSRVTSAQMPHISFPRDGRYQPVRTVSTYLSSSKSVSGSAERYAGGGGILILDDRRPDETPDFIEFTTQAVAAAPDAEEPPRNLHISLDESAPEAPPPESFEVSVVVSRE